MSSKNLGMAKLFASFILAAVLLLGAVGLVASGESKVYTDSETIRQVQNDLNALGYECGAADGIAGSKTQNAIIAFKQEHDMIASADVTEDFLNKLAEEVRSGESDQKNTTQYNKNGFTYSVPDSWVLDSDGEDSLFAKFLINGDEKNIALIRAEEIAPIMKIDVGDGAILTKEDLVDEYSKFYGEEINREWKTAHEFVYCEVLLNMSDGRFVKAAIIPVNETEAVFSVAVITNDEANFDGINVCLASIEFPAEEEDLSEQSGIRDISKIMNTLMDLPTYTSIQYSDAVEKEGLTAYAVKYNNSVFYVAFNPDNDGTFTIIAMPYSLDEDTGSNDLLDFLGFLAQAASGSSDGYASFSCVVQAYNLGSFTQNGITYEFDDGLFTINY